MGSQLGVVVIGRNEGARLHASLSSVIGAANIIVYVDSGSTDDSVAVAARMGACVVELDPRTPFTAARARNAGFEAMLSNRKSIRYVQFLDGDCVLLDGWLDAAAEFMDAHPNVAAVCGRRYERFPAASIFNRMCDREWDTPIGNTKSCGGDSYVRVSCFQEVGGFRSEQVAHEEPELCGRLRAAGYSVWRLDKPMTLHDAGMTRISQFYSRSRRAGFGIAQYILNASRGLADDGSSIVVRALAWSFIPPFLLLVGVWWIGLKAALVLLLYPAQILRHTLRMAGGDYPLKDAAKVATLSMLGKFAEAQGAVEYVIKRLLRREMRPILYR